MPRVTYSAFIEDISGAMAGSIFKRTIQGSIIERRKSPRLPRSPKQQQTRGLMNNLAGRWYQMPAINKEMWTKFASLQSKRISGYNAYIQLNIRLLKANHANLVEVTFPPLTPATAEYVAGFAAAHALGQDTITWTAPIDPQTYVQVYYSAEFGFSLLRKEHWSLLETVSADTGQVIHALQYPAGTPIAYKARSINLTGRISPDTETLPPIS